MTQVSEKYKTTFTYADDNQGTIAISTISPLLSKYINGFNTPGKVAELYFAADSLLKNNKWRHELPPATNDIIKISLTLYDVELFKDHIKNSDNVTENSFNLPLVDLFEIIHTWQEFILANKTRNVEITTGQGIIDIITDGFANALVIKKPIAVSWPDCRGSVGEYYAVSDYNCDEQSALTAGINQAVSNGRDGEIFDAISIFLKLFNNGVYNIAISDIDVEFENIGHDSMLTYDDSIPLEERFTYNDYSYGMGVFLFSRSYSTINEDRVAEYIKLITEGARPKVVVYHLNSPDSATNPYYIIDGHHKLLAYQKLHISAPAIYIKKTAKTIMPRKNITPQIMGILKKQELYHILLNNDNVSDVDAYMNENITAAIDEIFYEDKSIGTYLSMLLYNNYHAVDQNQCDWAKKRLSVLANNKNIGNRLNLYYKTMDAEKRPIFWKLLYIENKEDFKQWKDIFLNGAEITLEYQARQKEISDRYNSSIWR